MGNFYVNYTLFGPSQTAVAAMLAGRSAIVTSAQNGSVVVFDEESDEQSLSVLAKLAGRLSNELQCPVLTVLNHDDDILRYLLHLKGELVDEYDSSPGYFDPTSEPAAPSGGDATRLCNTFGVNDFAEVENILRKSSFDEGGYLFAVDRHSDLITALQLPNHGVGYGYANLASGDFPEGLKRNDVMKVN